MLTYGWAIVTKTVHQLRILQCSKSDNRSPTIAHYCDLSKAHDHVVITLPAPAEKWPMGSSLKILSAVQFHNCSLCVNDDTGFVKVTWPSYYLRDRYLCFIPMEFSPKAMIVSWLWSISGFNVLLQICPEKNVSHHGSPAKKTLVSWKVICSYKCA